MGFQFPPAAITPPFPIFIVWMVKCYKLKLKWSSLIFTKVVTFLINVDQG